MDHTNTMHNCVICGKATVDCYRIEEGDKDLLMLYPLNSFVCKDCYEVIMGYVLKMRILESTITSMTTTMAMKDVHIRTLEAEVKRLQDIVTSN